MRGKVINAIAEPVTLGITPAYAGKRLPLPDIAAQTQDHPYVCGEKYDCSGQKFTNWGSPPRMRGKVLPPYLLRGAHRITPAYAGKRAHKG